MVQFWRTDWMPKEAQLRGAQDDLPRGAETIVHLAENESMTGGAGVGTKGHWVLPHSALGAIVRGGALCGVLDITAAFVVYGGLYGVNPVAILQGIASGILGRSAFDGGYPVALLGLFLHFLIAFTATFVYVQLSRWVSPLVQHVYVAGPLYGVVVYFFMGYIVIPVSAHSKGGAFSFRGMIIGVVIHIFCVGLPISLTTRRYLHT